MPDHDPPLDLEALKLYVEESVIKSWLEEESPTPILSLASVANLQTLLQQADNCLNRFGETALPLLASLSRAHNLLINTRKAMLAITTTKHSEKLTAGSMWEPDRQHAKISYSTLRLFVSNVLTMNELIARLDLGTSDARLELSLRMSLLLEVTNAILKQIPTPSSPKDTPGKTGR